MEDSQKLDLIFHALADSTRRAILKRIATQEATVTELAEPFKMSLAAVSKHLKVLESAGLLVRTKDGRIHRCKLDAEPLKKAETVLHEYYKFWEGQLEALDRYLQDTIFEDEKSNKKNN